MYFGKRVGTASQFSGTSGVTTIPQCGPKERGDEGGPLTFSLGYPGFELRKYGQFTQTVQRLMRLNC